MSEHDLISETPPPRDPYWAWMPPKREPQTHTYIYDVLRQKRQRGIALASSVSEKSTQGYQQEDISPWPPFLRMLAIVGAAFLTVSKPGMGRRRFLRAGGTALTVGFLGACSSAPVELSQDKTNIALAQSLRDGLTITPDMTRSDMITVFKTLTFHSTDTQANTSLGTFVNQFGERQNVSLDEHGEPLFAPLHNGSPVEFPAPLDIQQKIIQSGNNYIVLYGTVGSIGRLSQHESEFQSFAAAYFKDTKGKTSSGGEPIGVLHINLCPVTATQVPFADIGGIPMRTDDLTYDQGLTSIVRNPDDGTIRRADIFINTNRIMNSSLLMGVTPRDALYNGLANEQVNMMARAASGREVSNVLGNERVSSEAGLLAMVDPVFQSVILGGPEYSGFVNPLGDEMTRLPTTGTH